MEGGNSPLGSGDPEPKSKHPRIEKIVEGAETEIKTSQLEMAGSSESDLYNLRYPHVSTEKYTELALECYQKKHGTEHATYTIVRALGSFRVLAMLPGFEEIAGVLDWCHVSFIAMDSRDNAELLFFVELVDFGYGDSLGLNNFYISNPNSPEITYGCGFCPSEEIYPHHRGSYFAGNWDYKPIDATSQQELAITFQNQVSSIKQQIQQKERSPYFKPKFGNWKILPDVERPDPSIFSPPLSDDGYAKIALSYISKLEGVEYELESTLYANCLMLLMARYGLWCHVVLSAKPKNTNGPSITFFAELHDPGNRKFELSIYDVFDPKDPRNRRGCGFCRRREMVHPWPEDLQYSAGSWPLTNFEDEDDEDY